MQQQKDDLVLVRLNDHQIWLAKEANGTQKKITHAVLCGRYGEKFGTRLQCTKCFDAWQRDFGALFIQAFETAEYPIVSYKTTLGLFAILAYEYGRRQAAAVL